MAAEGFALLPMTDTAAVLVVHVRVELPMVVVTAVVEVSLRGAMTVEVQDNGRRRIVMGFHNEDIPHDHNCGNTSGYYNERICSDESGFGTSLNGYESGRGHGNGDGDGWGDDRGWGDGDGYGHDRGDEYGDSGV